MEQINRVQSICDPNTPCISQQKTETELVSTVSRQRPSGRGSWGKQYCPGSQHGCQCILPFLARHQSKPSTAQSTICISERNCNMYLPEMDQLQLTVHSLCHPQTAQQLTSPALLQGLLLAGSFSKKRERGKPIPRLDLFLLPCHHSATQYPVGSLPKEYGHSTLFSQDTHSNWSLSRAKGHSCLTKGHSASLVPTAS